MGQASVWSGVSIAMQSALASAKTITAITKATTAVATSTAHGYANGDILVLAIQGMSELDNRVVRAANVTTNTFELEGVDSTLFNTFTSGTAQAATFGTTLGAAAGVNVSGGDFNMIDVTTIADNINKQIPGNANPISISMDCNWDPTDAGLIAMKSASDAKAMRAFRVTFANGYKVYFNGYVGATNFPTGSAQQKVSTPVNITVYGRTTTYTT